MKRSATLAAAAVLSSIAALGSAEAVPAAAQGMAAAPQTETALQRVHYRGEPYYGWYRAPRLSYYHGPNVTLAYWRGPRYRSYYRPEYYGGGYYTPVGYRYPACRAWARECAARWGWRTWRWARCMRIHAC